MGSVITEHSSWDVLAKQAQPASNKYAITASENAFKRQATVFVFHLSHNFFIPWGSVWVSGLGLCSCDGEGAGSRLSKTVTCLWAPERGP